jgi:hypothetical protein
MSTFNRILTTLLLLALIPIVTVALIVPQEAVQLLLDGLEQIDDQLDSSVSVGEMVVRVGLALLVDAVLVILVYLELRRSPKYGVPVRQIKGGDARIATDSIVDRLTYKIDQLPGVLAVEPQITARRRGMEVTLQIEVVADAHMRANIEEISVVTRQVVEEEMGLNLVGKPKLNLRTVLYPESLAGTEVMEPDLAALESAQEATRRDEDEFAFPDTGSDTEIGGADEPGGDVASN